MPYESRSRDVEGDSELFKKGECSAKGVERREGSRQIVVGTRSEYLAPKAGSSTSSVKK